ASAFAKSGAYQLAAASGGGDAVGYFTNADGAEIHFLAKAQATGSDAFANATAKSGVVQSINAAGGGNAVANLANDGVITVSASAYASGTASQAGAFARVGSTSGTAGIIQVANAGFSGDATATMVNSGSMVVAAVAHAQAGSHVVGIGESATTVVGDAQAIGIVYNGVRQFANGINATANLTNGEGAVIDVTAAADAHGNDVAFTSTTKSGAESPVPGA